MNQRLRVVFLLQQSLLPLLLESLDHLLAEECTPVVALYEEGHNHYCDCKCKSQQCSNHITQSKKLCTNVIVGKRTANIGPIYVFT